MDTSGFDETVETEQRLRDRAYQAEQREDWPTAAESWAIYRTKFSPVWFSYAGEAHALRRLGRLEEAELLFRETTILFRDEAGVLMVLVDLLTSQGRLSEAYEAIIDALSHRPNKLEFLLLHAELAIKLKLPDAAFMSWRDLPTDSSDLVPRRILVACDILRLTTTSAYGPELLECLIAEEDDGTIGWLPRSAYFLHGLVLDPHASLVPLVDFYYEHPDQIQGSTHRLIWLAVLGLPLSPADLDEVIERIIEQGRFGLASILFSAYVLSQRRAWRDAILRRLNDHVLEIAEQNIKFINPRPCLSILLVLAVFSMYYPDDFWPLAVWLRGRVEDGSVPGSASQILARLVSGTSRSKWPDAAPALISRTDTRLHIAVCISGQLRGYREAFPTWQSTGIFDHRVRIFVHTWHNVGLNWMRNWDFMQFTYPAVHAILARPEGPKTLAQHFPTLAQATAADLAMASRADTDGLRNFYGTEFVKLEDDTQPPFIGLRNDWKMLSKIKKAHELALYCKEDFDLFVRIRPDIGLDLMRTIDFPQLAFESSRDHKIFLDSPVLFTAPDGKLKAGDQLAIGSLGPMDVYANTVDFDPAGAALIGAPAFHTAHETLGNALFVQGVISGPIEGIRQKQLLNPAVLTPLEVAALAERDATSAPDTDLTRQFLDACRQVARVNTP